LETYKRIGENLPLFSEIEDIFHSQTRVQQDLVRVYVDILTFHKRAISFFKQSGEHPTTHPVSHPTALILADHPAWKVGFDVALHKFGDISKDVLENLDRSRKLLFSSANVAHFRTAADDSEAQVEKEKMEQRKAVKQWLSAVSCADYHEELQRKRKQFPGTTQWVLDHPVIKQWLHGPEPVDQPLWLRGIPGAGT
jgi:hypothetical protein